MRLESVCVFCGSNPGTRPAYGEAARELGAALARRGVTLVYGGADRGLMGELASAAQGAGGRVEGVIPDFFEARDLLQEGLDEVVTVPSMAERKQRMIGRASAFVALPGGFGTLDEVFEVLVLDQIGGLGKPVGFLDVEGFYAPLLDWMAGAVGAGFLRPDHLDLLVRAEAVEELLEGLEAHEMPAMPDLVASPVGTAE